MKPRSYGHFPSPTPSMSHRGIFNKTHLLSPDLHTQNSGPSRPRSRLRRPQMPRLGTRVTLSCVTGFHGSRVAEMVPPVHWLALTLHACFEHQLSHQLHTKVRVHPRTRSEGTTNLRTAHGPAMVCVCFDQKLLTCWCTVTHGKCDYEDTACTHVRFFAQNLLISIHPVSFMITLASCSNIVLNI